MVTLTVLDQGTPVHTLPVKESATIKTLSRGTSVELTGAGQSRFLQVRVQGATGWIYSNHLIGQILGANNVRLRSEPEINPGNILVEGMLTGTRVIPTGREIDGFVSIRYLDVEGWAHGDLLGPAPNVAPLQGGIVCAKRNNVAVHADPLEESPTIKKVPKNGKARLLGEANANFLKVAYAGAEGWIHSQHLCGSTLEPGVRLRAQANAGQSLATLTRYSVVDLTGKFQDGFLSVSRGDTDGWIHAALLGPVPASPMPPMSALWNGDDGQFTVSQAYGPTQFSMHEHPEWYAYGLDYCPDWCADFPGDCPPGHTGLDLNLPYGTEVFSPYDGVVVCNGTSSNGCAAFSCGQIAQGEFCEGIPNAGRFELRLANGARLILGHMSRITVAIGQQIKAGDRVGFSGRYNGDHVHVEYRDMNPPCPRNINGARLIDPCEMLMTNEICFEP